MIYNFQMLKKKKIIIYSIILFLGILTTLPFVAPILSHYGYKRVSNFIYDLYSLFCHQKAHRSVFIFDEQCAWCVRDTFLWSTLFICACFIFSTKNTYKIDYKFTIILCVPLILDGGIQLISTLVSLNTGQTPFYESTNFIRSITAALFGIGISFFFFPRINKELGNLP